ncbi:hypothetical protein PIB30_008674 [Stylosanthes scabra]|uniref:Reverse transcriptase domain-containing protein n=1 Tax=Stylosanthes scabra TaxID=79078 RepID=A0ABU6T4V3_9FABA|nr:hypothetical protein [Stylosanthes scabra]
MKKSTEWLRRPKTNNRCHEETPQRRTLGTLNGNKDKGETLSSTSKKIYQQISDKNILPRARTLRRRTQNAKNKTLFGDYHQGYGHKTQDCYDLKDAIEQAIREAKLNEFAQIIREPRNTGRERSEAPETRNPRNHRETDETMPIVSVITGANHTEKSKSAHKNDLKILSAVRIAPPQMPTIAFNGRDFENGVAESDAPMVISARVGPGIVRRTLVDTDADSNIMF